MATTIDICAGYVVGKWIQKRFQGTRFSIWSEHWANKIENLIGKKGEKFAIALLGVINFPYVNSFFISWLKLPFRNIFILLFVGDLMYWIIAWLINISIRNYFSNPHTVLYIVIGIGLLISIVSKFVLTKILKKS